MPSSLIGKNYTVWNNINFALTGHIYIVLMTVCAYIAIQVWSVYEPWTLSYSWVCRDFSVAHEIMKGSLSWQLHSLRTYMYLAKIHVSSYWSSEAVKKDNLSSFQFSSNSWCMRITGKHKLCCTTSARPTCRATLLVFTSYHGSTDVLYTEHLA